MNGIGGYFELELRKGQEYHPKAIHLNTGRNALELILMFRKYSMIYIPYYVCDVVLEPIKKLGINYKFYSIDTNLEPLLNYNIIKGNIGLLYINYFGLKDNFIFELRKYCKNLIIDNSQAFFAKPLIATDTFYSSRKFFGVPDGAYVYIDGIKTLKYPIDISMDRILHLTKRIELGPEKGFEDFKLNGNNLIGQPIKIMSKLTQALLSNIDYNFIYKRRRDNFLYLQQYLHNYNKFKWNLTNDSVPMVYPLLSDSQDLRQKLINNKIYVATYWPNVLEWVKEDSTEYLFAKNIIPLPIDQRINNIGIRSIVREIEKIL